MGKKHIIIVEDDQDLSTLLEVTLTTEGYSVAVVKNKEECDKALTESPADLMIIDINLNLPDLNGLDLCRELRKTLKIPILILSGSTDDIDKILALEMGANNYLTKPINPRVLLSFIKTTFSFSQPEKSVEKEVNADSVTLHFSHFVLTLDTFTLSTDKGELITITPSEFKVLRVLAEHPKRVLSREQLLDYIGVNSEIYDRSIDRFISRLRKKLEVDPKNPALIKSVYGEGYIFDVQVTQKGLS